MALEKWEKGSKAKVAPPPEGKRMSLFTLRLDQATLRALVELGRREGVGPSVIARRILQEGVKKRGADLSFEAEVQQVFERILRYGYDPPH
jgi:hypothetical protein